MITDQTSIVQATGNGSTTAFSFGHYLFAASDLVVTVFNPTTSVTSVKTIATDYTVALTGSFPYTSGGTVNFITAPGNGTTVTISRVLSATQLVTFTTNGAFQSAATEQALDRLTMLYLQALAAVNPYTTFSSFNQTTPVAADVTVATTTDAGLYEINFSITTVTTGAAGTAQMILQRTDIAGHGGRASVGTALDCTLYTTQSFSVVLSLAANSAVAYQLSITGGAGFAYTFQSAVKKL